jgi:NADPH:quinone reductase
MRRVRYYAHGGPEVLGIEETEVPEPGPQQALIRVEAIGLNYVDVQLRRETSPDSIYYRKLPSGVTGDTVGIVERVGPDTDPALIGTRVAVLLEDGCADYVVADVAWMASVPDGLDVGAASMLPTIGAVAQGVLHIARPIEDQTVLVTAGAGAIGHLAVQLAKRQGARTVIATASSPAKLDFARELGADVAINHTDPDWDEQIRRAVPGGVDVVLDAVGGDALHRAIGLLAPFGRAAVFGASSGDLTSVPVRSLFALKTVSGFSLLAYRAAAADQLRAQISELADLLLKGELRAATDTRLPMSDIVEAHRLLEARAVLGRVILLP